MEITSALNEESHVNPSCSVEMRGFFLTSFRLLSKVLCSGIEDHIHSSLLAGLQLCNADTVKCLFSYGRSFEGKRP